MALWPRLPLANGFSAVADRNRPRPPPAIQPPWYVLRGDCMVSDKNQKRNLAIVIVLNTILNTILKNKLNKN